MNLVGRRMWPCAYTALSGPLRRCSGVFLKTIMIIACENESFPSQAFCLKELFEVVGREERDLTQARSLVMKGRICTPLIVGGTFTRGAREPPAAYQQGQKRYFGLFIIALWHGAMRLQPSDAVMARAPPPCRAASVLAYRVVSAPQRRTEERKRLEVTYLSPTGDPMQLCPYHALACAMSVKTGATPPW